MSRPTTEPHRQVRTSRCVRCNHPAELHTGRGCDAGACRCPEDARIVAAHGNPATLPMWPGHQDAVGLLRGQWPKLLPASQEWLDHHQAGAQ